MGLFFNPRKNKEKWASIVFAKGSFTVGLTEEMLDAATALYVQQHARILYESINLFLTSKNASTRKNSYKLANQHLESLCNVRRFANKEMQKVIDQAYADFQIAEDKYKVVEEIKAQVSWADKIFIATDGDRSGEFISWSLLEYINIPKTEFMLNALRVCGVQFKLVC